MQVDEQGRTESHVFVGKVRLEVVGQSGGSNAWRVLHASEAVRIDRGDVIVLAANSSGVRFVRQLTAPEPELIGQVDYSDTWTVDSPTRYGGYRVLTSPEELRVEQCHGNPPRSWVFSAPTAVTTWPGGASARHWPGFGVRGARSGFTESPAAVFGSYMGFEYGLRDDFVVQFDAVQTQDRINISIGHEPATTEAARSLSVFFCASGGPHPEIGLYTPSSGEADTKLRSGIPAPFQWHNYAVRFNLPKKRLTVWVDGDCRGTIDLAGVTRGMETEGHRTWADLPLSNRYVTVGGYTEKGEGTLWTDNFRLGAPAKDLVQEKRVTKGGDPMNGP